MSRSYIFKTFIQNNVNLTFGSDWDVTPINPLEGIYAAVSRKTLNEDDLLASDSLHPNGLMYFEWAKKIYEKWID